MTQTINAFHPDYVKTYEPNLMKGFALQAQNSKTITKEVEKRRAKNPTHGTLFGISNKVVSLKPTEYMTYSRAGTKNTTAKKKGKS
jgi:hypothetical protein